MDRLWADTARVHVNNAENFLAGGLEIAEGDQDDDD